MNIPQKIHVRLNKGDGRYIPNRDALTDCLVARAIKRALAKAGFDFLTPRVGYRTVWIGMHQYSSLPKCVENEVNKWVDSLNNEADYSPKLLKFTLYLQKPEAPV